MNWPFILVKKAVVITAVIFVIYLISKKHKRIFRISLAIGILAFLLIPEKWVFKDGGSTQYWAPLWTHITLKNINGKVLSKHFFLFPDNFVDVGDLSVPLSE